MLTVVTSDSKIIGYIFLFAYLHFVVLLQLMYINYLMKYGSIVILEEHFFFKS